MGIILPQINEITICSNNVKYYKELGYSIPSELKNGKKRVKRGTKIQVHTLDLTKGSHTMVKVQCDECGKIYLMPYKDYLTNYCVQKIGKLFCFDCINPAMSKYGIATQKVWSSKDYALKRLDNYIKTNGTLKGWTVNNREGANICGRLREHGYDLEELCTELGYDYYKLRDIYYPEGFLYNYENLKSILQTFIDNNGYFPSQKQMRYDLHIPESIPSRFGGSEKIMKDMGIVENYLIDDRGFYNRSYYEYILAQYLIHNNIFYEREQCPFPYPNDKLRSDFKFTTKDGIVYHLELWGYLSGYEYLESRANQYLKRKEMKKALYKKYNINLIEVDARIFSNNLSTIQNKLSVILSDILNVELKKVKREYIINPKGLTNDELFNSAMKYSVDGITLPETTLFQEKDTTLFNEILLRFDNLNNFAREYGVRTNNKRGFWNKNSILETMFIIKDKYGFMPTCTYIRNNKLSKTDKIFVGFTSAIKDKYNSTIDGYLTFFEKCKEKCIPLHENEIKYLNNIVTHKAVNKKSVKDSEIQRAKLLLKEVA